MEQGLMQEKMNDYEQLRIARIAQNEAKMKALGIQRKSKMSASSMKRNNSNTQKEKEKTNPSYEADMEYHPSHNEEEDHHVAPSGSRHRARYIPPRSMKKFTNIVKQGLVVDKQDLFNNRQKGSETEPLSIEEPTYEQQEVDGVRLGQNKNGNKLTMADLILQKKSLRGANEVLNHQLDQSSLTNFRENVAIGSQRRNSYVQVPSDMGDISTRSFVAEQEPHPLNQSEREGSPLLNKSVESSTEDEDIPFDYEESTEDESEDVDLDNTHLELEATLNKKRRGPTMLHHVRMRPYEKREPIILNEFGQLIGPVFEKKDPVGEFSRFLGTIARDYDYAPLVFGSWKKIPNKDKMWEYVLMKYDVPEEGKEWVIKTIGSAWRIHKCRFKRKHYYRYKDDKTRWQNRSKTVPDEDFMKLLATWKKKTEKVRCSRNRNCRLAQKNMHTAGPKSFAIIREEMRNEHPNKEAPSLAALFERTRTRKVGRKYKEPYEDTAQKIEAMKNYVPPDDDDDESGPTDAFVSVMGKDYDGRRRLYGRGVCNKKLKKVSGTAATSYVVPAKVLETLKASLVEEVRKDMSSDISKVEQMQRELVEEHEKKKREMEEEHEKKKEELENIQRNIDKEREIMTEQIMRKIIGKLPSDVARQYLC